MDADKCVLVVPERVVGIKRHGEGGESRPIGTATHTAH